MDDVLRLLDESGCELVSYGLAPNPWGFCFERGEETSDEQASALHKALEALSDEETTALRKVFL